MTERRLLSRLSTPVVAPLEGNWLTLVVASRFVTGIRIFRDTRVTYPQGENPHYLRGTLKAILLHPALCIAYAGDVASALSAIRDLRVSRSSGFSLEKVESFLERAHNRTSAEMEFIVASALDGETFTVIKEGRATRTGDCWIGDIFAFEEYQRLFHTAAPISQSTEIDPTLAADLQVANRMNQAMEGVAASSSVASVGELILNVVLTKDGFVYAPRAWMQGGRSQTIPSGVPTKVQFGGAAEGGFAYSVLSSQTLESVRLAFIFIKVGSESCSPLCSLESSLRSIAVSTMTNSGRL